MKKLLLLLTVLCGMVGTVWAQSATMPLVSDAPTDGEWAANTYWYTIKNAKGYYFNSGTADDSGNLMLNNSTKSHEDAALWCITGNDTDGYKFYNKAKGATLVLGTTGSEASARASFVEATSSTHSINYFFKESAKSGYWCVRIDKDGNNYWNQRDSYLALWNDSHAVTGWDSPGDDGSALLIEPVVTDWSCDGKEYYLKDKCGTYLDIHNLGKEANDPTKDRLATLSSTPQTLFITQGTFNGTTYWRIHTAADGGNYLKQASTRQWNTWVSEGADAFMWEVETVTEDDITYYKLKNISGIANGNLGTTNHTDGESLYTNGTALQLQLIEKVAGQYTFAIPDGYAVTYGGNEYTNGDEIEVNEELDAASFTVTPDAPKGYETAVTIDNENQLIIVTLVIDLTAFTDGTKWVFKNRGEAKYLSAMLEGGQLDNSVTPTTKRLAHTSNLDYTHCWQLVATTYNETSCFMLYNPYYDWYAGNITTTNKSTDLAKTDADAGKYCIETVDDYIAIRCISSTLTGDNAERNCMHLYNWTGNNIVGWSDDSNSSHWSFEAVSDDIETSWFTSLSTEAETLKTRLEQLSIGTGIGQYQGKTQEEVTEAANSIDIPTTGTTAEKIKGAVYSLYNTTSITDELTLNMPTAGFYRIKSQNVNDWNKENSRFGKYLQLKEDESGFEETSDATIRGIVYINEANNILHYVNGLYQKGYGAPAAVGAQADTWSFTANPTQVGVYSLKASSQGNYLSDWSGIAGGQNDENAAWTFEEVTELPVTITSAGYATFYSPVAVTLPEGLTAYYVSSVVDASAKMTEVDGVIPANTGVILQGEPETYYLTVGGEATEVENQLSGSVASEYVNTASYVLSKQNEVVGFYKATMNFTVDANGAGTKVTENGTHFLSNGFKAYLPKPADASAETRFFVFDFGGEETGIDELKGENGNVKTEIYDLSGRCVQNAQKGVYVVNGKVVIK